MQKPLFFVADAHEGPVWVADQCRLYFNTKTHLDTVRRVDIRYLDFAALNVCSENELWENLSDDATRRVPSKLFLHDINMANGMRLAAEGRSLLVAEQGYGERKSVISRIQLADGTRSVIQDEFNGQPFNSINKVIPTKNGHLVFSDPDYGFRQGFRPAPVLEPNVYTLTADGEMKCFRCSLEMPHGLALTPDEKTLFITDTSNEGAHGEGIDLQKRKSVWKYDFDALTGAISGPGICCFEVDQGVPDGAVCTGGHLLVGGGDGVYVADLRGNLVGKIPTKNDAVNLALAANDRHLFVTIDEGVELFRNWRAHVEKLG